MVHASKCIPTLITCINYMCKYILNACILNVIIYTGSDSDLEYFVRECGKVLGVTSKLPQELKTGKGILEFIFAQLVEFKKSSQVCIKCVTSLYYIEE